ncbi:MAG: sugar ABC transporter permease [Chloroflexota bacterium]|nr:sugar ABC transporter permease [Chloroflexota bacterium]
MTAIAKAPPLKAKPAHKRRTNLTGYLLSAPYVIYNIIFWVYPFIWGFIIAFQEWNIISPEREFVYFDNFVTALKNEQFWNALWVTFRFWIFFLPAVTIASLGLAMLLQRIDRFRGLYIAGYMASYTMAGVAYAVVFQLLFAGNGLINNWIWRLFHVRVPWFTNPRIAVFSIGLVVVWKYIGYYALIFLSGLQAIPRELYEAASMDGANAWTRFWRITVPLLNPSFTVIFVFATILAFGIFTEPFMITGGGPLGSTQTFMLLIYQKTFENLEAGYGSALAILMAAFSFGATSLVRKAIEREVAL